MWWRSTCTRATLAALILALAPAGAPRAAPLEKLLMPGDLVEGHAKLEEDCKNCHQSFTRSNQAQLCLACHKDVNKDVAAKTGFHGRSASMAGKDCHDCHSDHKGRGADIVGLMPALFDHRETDFPLAGAHAVQECGACHAKGKRYREAAAACASCHKKDDVHRGQMGAQCQNCHTAENWGASGFDHDKTRFALRDKHRDVACAACHADAKYKGTTTSCAGCHQMQDPHGGLFGAQCGSCHGAKAWNQASFDHTTRTHFPLTGQHKTVECHACHTEQTRGKPVPKACVSCHAASDVHQGRFGQSCDKCHSAEGWQKGSFQHDRDTGFPLRGAHRTVTCDACHATTPRKGEAKRVRGCADCHGATDPHHGQQGPLCGACHDEKSWSGQVRFDHDLTRFPLLGLHETVGCRECHADAAQKSAPMACVACHRKDDAHKGAFGERCESCHSATGWKGATFDHATMTRFPLEGAHAALACTECHRAPPGAGSALPTACAGCHARDDVHQGAFGTDCGRCHNGRSFKGAEFVRPGAQPPGQEGH